MGAPALHPTGSRSYALAQKEPARTSVRSCRDDARAAGRAVTAQVGVTGEGRFGQQDRWPGRSGCRTEIARQSLAVGAGGPSGCLVRVGRVPGRGRPTAVPCAGRRRTSVARCRRRCPRSRPSSSAVGSGPGCRPAKVTVTPKAAGGGDLLIAGRTVGSGVPGGQRADVHRAGGVAGTAGGREDVLFGLSVGVGKPSTRLRPRGRCGDSGQLRLGACSGGGRRRRAGADAGG